MDTPSTLRIALRTGIGVRTVSRALRGGPVRESTRRAITDAARSLRIKLPAVPAASPAVSALANASAAPSVAA